MIEADKTVLWLTPGTVTDIQQLCDWAGRAIEGHVSDADMRILQWDPEAADILPGWYDDWVICERERIRQRLLHGLEAVGRELLLARRPADAIEAAMCAVRIEPLRESAQQLLVEAHLAERNYGEALRTYRTYARLLRQELGIAPGPVLGALVANRSLTGACDSATDPEVSPAAGRTLGTLVVRAWIEPDAGPKGLRARVQAISGPGSEMQELGAASGLPDIIDLVEQGLRSILPLENGD